MYAFKCARQRKRIVDFAATSFSRSQAQNRPQTFSASKQTVAHRPVNCRRLGIRLRQVAVQRVVDQFLASDKILFKIHVAETADGLLDC
jgi:hypothetical protein